VQGWCRDISEGGMSGTVAMNLKPGTEVQLAIPLPGIVRPIELAAVVRHVRGATCGFRFIDPPESAVAEIRNFAIRGTTSAYLLSPDPELVREMQRRLQQLGMPQVTVGSPKQLPVLHPHLVVIDSDWPDYLEVINFLRAEATKARIVILGLVSAEGSTKEALAAGADLVMSKPIQPTRSQSVLRLACHLVWPGADLSVATPLATPA
jgi:CheY-like chemotaxis protein